MGLDMYLWNENNVNEEEIEEIGYWRKANAIHNWFVKTCQDGIDECKKTLVTKDQLQELLELCNRVIFNRELAEELLPTQGGFFFGGTDYDEYYFGDLEETVDIIEKALETPDGYNIYYQSSW